MFQKCSRFIISIFLKLGSFTLHDLDCIIKLAIAFLLATVDISACFITFQSAVFNSVFYFLFFFLFHSCATRSPRQQQTFNSFACRMLCRTLCSPVCRPAPTLSDRRKSAPSCEKTTTLIGQSAPWCHTRARCSCG